MKTQPLPAKVFSTLLKLAEETKIRSKHLLAFHLNCDIHNDYIIKELATLHAISTKLVDIFNRHLSDGDEEAVTVTMQDLTMISAGVKEVTACHEELRMCGVHLNLN